MLPFVGFLLLAPIADCAPLAPLAASTCGNGVVDSATEDCDTFAPDGQTCGAPGDIAACRFACGAHTHCPTGFGCGATGVCRKPSGAFGTPVTTAIPALRLVAGDFDGDARLDILAGSAGPTGKLDAATVLYFDEHLGIEATREIPGSAASTAVADFDGDGRSDVAFISPDQTVTRLFGRSDRTLAAVPDATFSFADGTTRVFWCATLAELGILVASGDDTVVYGAEPEGAPIPLVRIRGHFAPAPGAMWTGKIHSTDACETLLLAFPDVRRVVVYPLCDMSGHAWNTDGPATMTTISLDSQGGPEPSVGRVLGTDMDGDGNLDVEIEGNGLAYVALGSETGLAQHAFPFKVGHAGGSAPDTVLPFALASGDVNGDGNVDFVTSDSLWTTYSDGNGNTASAYDRLAGQRVPWSGAAITDLNGNGRPDAIAWGSTAAALDFFDGTYGGLPTPLGSIPTKIVPDHVAIGDFDGDLVPDLAVGSQNQPGSEVTQDEIRIIYGRFGLPTVAADGLAIDRLSQLIALPALPPRTGTRLAGVYGPFGSPMSKVSLLSAAGAQVVSGLRLEHPPSALASGKFAHGADVAAIVEVPRPPATAKAATRIPALALLVPGDGIDVRTRSVTFLGAIPGVSRIVPSSVRAADVDGDGVDDLVAVGADGAANMLVVMKGGGITNVATTPLPSPPFVSLFESNVLEIADFDRDGAADIAFMGADDVPHLYVLWNDGAGGFDAAHVSALGSSAEPPTAFTRGNVDGSGAPSLVFTTFSAAYAISFDPATRVSRSGLVATLGGHAVVVADIDGDGVDDIAVGDGASFRAARGIPVLP